MNHQIMAMKADKSLYEMVERLTMAMYNKNDKIIYVDPKAEILTLPVGICL